MFVNLTGKQKRLARVIRLNRTKREADRSYTAVFERWAKTQHGSTYISGSELIGRGVRVSTNKQSENLLKRVLKRKK